MNCGFQTTDGAPEQFVLQKFDIASFCCVINKCQTRTSDKFKKCVHIVVLLCSKKTAAESYRLLREAYGQHAPWQDTCEPWFRRFKSGDFEVVDKKLSKPSKNLKMWASQP